MSRKRKLKYQAKKQERAEYREQQEFNRKFERFFATAGRLMGDFDLLWGRFVHHCGQRWQRWWWVALGIVLIAIGWSIIGTAVLSWGAYQVYHWWGTWDPDHMPTEEDPWTS